MFKKSGEIQKKRGNDLAWLRTTFLSLRVNKFKISFTIHLSRINTALEKRKERQ